MVDYAEIRERSVDEFKQDLLEIWDTLGITEPLHYGEGSLPGMLYEAISRISNRFTRMAVASKVLTLGEEATGEALTLWSRSTYGHERKSSTAAVHPVTLTCATGSGPHSLDVGSVVCSNGAVEFRLSAPPTGDTWPVSLTSAAPKTFGFTCEELGSVGATALRTITNMVTTYLGVTCSNNSAATTAGTDEETDAQLRTRNRTIWATRNPLSLTKDACEYFALAASDEIRRVRVVDNNPRGLYSVDLVLASDSGPASAQAIATVQAVFQGKLLNPFFSRWDFISASDVQLTLTGTVYYYSGFGEYQVKRAIQDAVNAFASDIPIGGFEFPGYGSNCLLRAQVEKVIEAATIAGQPCVKLAPLESPNTVVTLQPNDVVSFVVSWGTYALNLIPFTE